ncbi:MAG: hypothetical protein ABFD89_05280 [Bryobacteraceae bacterium]
MNEPIQTTAALVPFKGSKLSLKGDITSAKKWLDGAARCEAAKVFCQVMAGFELAILWKQAGIQNGGDHTSAEARAVSRDGKLLTHDQICELVGESKSQVYRYLAMARVCATRLKRMPELGDFNPLTTPIAQLPQAKADALQSVVHKLTDGYTQKEFGEKHGLWKKPSGNPNAKGSGQPDKKLTTEEEAALLREMAMTASGCMGKAIAASNKNFFLLTHVNDLEVNAQVAILDHALKLRRAWLALPKAKRDPAAIEPMLKDAPLK